MDDETFINKSQQKHINNDSHSLSSIFGRRKLLIWSSDDDAAALGFDVIVEHIHDHCFVIAVCIYCYCFSTGTNRQDTHISCDMAIHLTEVLCPQSTPSLNGILFFFCCCLSMFKVEKSERGENHKILYVHVNNKKSSPKNPEKRVVTKESYPYEMG